MMKLFIELVQKLDKKFFEPDTIRPPYTYFVTDHMYLRGKKYKLIWQNQMTIKQYIEFCNCQNPTFINYLNIVLGLEYKFIITPYRC